METMLIAEINKIEVCDKSLSRTLVKDISFNLPENKVYTIIGKNGSGKSTLIKSLTGLLEREHFKFRGRITFEGEVISGLSLKGVETHPEKPDQICFSGRG